MVRKKQKKRNSGVIISFLNMICVAIMKGLENGFFGKIFTSYDSIEEKARKGIIFGSMTRAPEGRAKSIRRKMLDYFDNSIIMKASKRAMRKLLDCRINLYGTYLIAFAVYALVVFFVDASIAGNGRITLESLMSEKFWQSVAVLLASIPLLFSRSTLISAVSESAAISSLIEDGAGISLDDTDSVIPVNGGSSYFVAILLGVMSSVITYFVSPLTVIVAIVLMICAILLPRC